VGRVRECFGVFARRGESARKQEKGDTEKDEGLQVSAGHGLSNRESRPDIL
jgi:hypothetical protein